MIFTRKMACCDDCGCVQLVDDEACPPCGNCDAHIGSLPFKRCPNCLFYFDGTEGLTELEFCSPKCQELYEDELLERA